MKNPLFVDFNGGNDKAIFDTIDLAKKEGRDGVIALNTYDGGSKHDQYAVFNPRQIKAAYENDGNWRTYSADIRSNP
jgi:dihydroorotate dehydrogenase